MKCKNPECQDPDFLDKIGSLASEFKWCPKCGAAIGQDDRNFNGDTNDNQATRTQSTENVQASSVESADQKLSDENAKGTTTADKKSSDNAAESATKDGKSAEPTPGIAGTTIPETGAAENRETATEETRTPETATTLSTATTEAMTGEKTLEAATAALETITTGATTASTQTTQTPTSEVTISDGATIGTPTSEAKTADGTTTPTPSSKATSADGPTTPASTSEASKADGTTTGTPSSEAKTADETTAPASTSEASKADGTATGTPTLEAATSDETTTPTTTISKAKRASSIETTITRTTVAAAAATTTSTVAATTALLVSTATKVASSSTTTTASTRTTTKVTTTKENEKQSGQTPKDNKGNPLRNDYMTVVFHALLSPYFDFKPQEGDRIIVCGEFSNEKNWRIEQVQMSPVRRTDSEYVLVAGKTKIPLRLARNKLPYKYVVVKQGDKKPKYQWEEIFDHPPSSEGFHTNRLLVIPDKCQKPVGIWHQYDDAVYSPPKTWSFFNRLLSFPNPVEGRYLAMKMMLPKWDSFSIERTNATFIKGSEALEIVNQVIYCMENKMISTSSYFQKLEFKDFSMEKALSNYIEPRLDYNISIQTSNDENIQAHRLATSLAITEIISNAMEGNTAYRPSRHNLMALFRSLAINVEFSAQKLQRILERLAKYYSKDSLKSRFSESILHLCQFTINKYPENYDWLLAMPLFHFLSESCQPYKAPLPLTDPAALQEKLCWGIHHLDLATLHKSAWTLQSTFEFLPQVKPFFDLDPLLQRTFLLSLPFSNLGECAHRVGILPHEVCWALARFLHDMSTQYFTQEQAKSINCCRKSMSEALEQSNGTNDGKQEPIYNEKELRSLSIALLQVIDRFLAKFDNNFNFICGFLNVLAKTLTMLKTSCLSTNGDNVEKDGEKSNDEFAKKHFEEALNKVIQGLCEANANKCINEELLMYSKLYETEISDEVLLEVWKGSLNKHLASRIDKMNDMKKIEFYSKLDFSKFHKEVETFFKGAAFDAVKNITKSERRSEHNEAFNQLKRAGAGESKKVGELLSLLMIQCWPKKVEEELGLLEHILTWKPFSDYLRFLCRGPDNFSDKCKFLLAQAISLLETIQHRISSSSIKVNTLQVIQRKKEIFLELVTQTKGDDELKRNLISEDLEESLSMLEMFENELKELKSFLKIPFIIQNVDVQHIKERVDIDVSELEIQNLAVHLQKKVKVKFFQISDELKEMVRKLHVVFPSEIFQNIWKQNFKDAKKDFGCDKMALETVLESIWKPTYHECRELLSSVFKGKISLEEVDQYFQSFKNRCQDLQKNFSILSKACGIVVEEEDVLSQVQKIERYNKMKACINAAEKVLEFQQNMELDRGGFAVVEELRLQISPESKTGTVTVVAR